MCIFIWSVRSFFWRLVGITTDVWLEQIPKPNETEGLGIQWPAKATDMTALKELYETVKAKM